MPDSHQDFRHFLHRELELRQTANPLYSARTFAADLGLSPQMLSQILRGVNGISVQKALEISNKLTFEQNEKELFIALVESKHHRHFAVRKKAQEKIKVLLLNQKMESVSAKDYRQFLDWHYNAIILLVETPSFVPSVSYIANSLGLKYSVAKSAVNKLFKAGLIRKDSDGIWVRGKSNYAIKGGHETPEIRNYYSQYIEKAKLSISQTPIDDRDISMSLMTIHKDDLKEVKVEIEKFRQFVMQKMSSKTTPADHVYSLGIQFFPISKPVPKRRAK